MKRMYSKGVVPGLLLIMTIIYLVEALKMTPPLKGGDITASFFPVVLAVIMFVSIAVVLWQSRTKTQTEVTEAEDNQQKATDPSSDTRPNSVQRYGPLWVTVLTALYIVSFSTFGYSAPTFLYVLTLILIFGNRNLDQGSKAWIIKIFAAVIITLLGYALFELIFQVRLPTLWKL